MGETTSTLRLWASSILRNRGDQAAPEPVEPVVLGPLQFVAASNDHDGVEPHAAIAAAAQHAMFQRICAYIEAHLASDALDAAHLMETFGMSRSHLCRLFEDAGGLANHIRTRRLETAVQRLAEDPQCSITDLLYEIGFTSPRQFQRAFRSHFGMSPLQWREHCHGVDSAAVEAQGSDCKG